MQMKAQVTRTRRRASNSIPQILNLKKILMPIDFSATSKQAFQYALRFAEQFGCEIILLHVVEPETVIAGTPLAVDIFADAGGRHDCSESGVGVPWQQARAIV